MLIDKPYIIKHSPLRTDLDWFNEEIFSKEQYLYANDKGVGFSQVLEDLKSEHQGEQSYFYGMSQLEIIKWMLENQNKEDRPLTALEETIIAARIDMKHDNVQKFFDYADTTVLFADLYKNQVVAGMLKSGVTDKIVMNSQEISSENYHKIYLEDTEKERQLSKVRRGSPFPKTRMSVSKQSIWLQKYARLLEVADETLKYQRLPLMAAAAQQIGLQLDIDKSNTAIYTMINGDGNSNTPGSTMSGSISDTDVIIEFYTKLASPYKVKKMLIRKAKLVKYLSALTGFTNLNMQFGQLPLSLPEWIEWDEATLGATQVLGFDPEYALEEVHTGALQTENDRIIDGQINQITFVWNGAYSVFQKNAICLFTASD